MIDYINREKIPVKLICSGRDKDYLHDGFLHWSEEDKSVMKIFKNIKSVWPKSADDVSSLFTKIFEEVKQRPKYIIKSIFRNK